MSMVRTSLASLMARAPPLLAARPYLALANPERKRRNIIASFRFAARPCRSRHCRVRFKRFQWLAAPCQALCFLQKFQWVKLQTVGFADQCRNAVATFVLRAYP